MAVRHGRDTQEDAGGAVSKKEYCAKIRRWRKWVQLMSRDGACLLTPKQLLDAWSRPEILHTLIRDAKRAKR